MSAPLLMLPSELQFLILQFIATGSSREQISDLIATSQTCRSLHHAVLCEKNDLVWRSSAIELGILPSVRLEAIIYPGSSTLEKRRWLNVVKLNYGWLQPFSLTRFRLQKAYRVLPPQEKNGNWFGRRTIEMVVSGAGTRKRPGYQAKQALSNSGGSVTFRISEESSNITATLDPALNQVTPLGSEHPQAPEWTATPFPCGVGYLVQKNNLGLRVSEYSESCSKSWNLEERAVDRFVSNENILVVVAFTESSPHIATKLSCVRSCSNETTISDKIWEIDVPVDWAEGNNQGRYGYAHLKNFHMTSTHVVCLVTRHPNERLGKLTRTEFIVVDLKTGEIVRKLRINTESSNPASGISQRAPFTTAFNHDFILTDIFIISGGPGGGLFVWDYSGKRDHFLYQVPNPWTTADSKTTNILRQYSDLTISVDGRYLGVTTSDQLLIFDMVSKERNSAYNNGRKVGKKARYMKNPTDDFPGGLWCWFRDWKSTKCKITGNVRWEEVDGGVAYLTDVMSQTIPANTESWNEHCVQVILRSILSIVSGRKSLIIAALVALAAWVYLQGTPHIELW
ncbi:hypothetical protein EDC01DRAFT_671100 [Geopyxis carbonaria]|nr:hypothetical protein EDC01DRAFT_671100 [Geopyxis carbonaria]